MTKTAIHIEDLGKRYQLGAVVDLTRTLRDTLTNLPGALGRRVAQIVPRRLRARQRDADSEDARFFWALRHVSLDIQEGEVVGIIGRNGAGKSTLLKILSRITWPTEGLVDLHGRVGALLEVGTGMHPELTGRENIYLNGSILGMRKREVDRKFDQIVDFAGIERFVDTPFKKYSSGMRVRLGFAVAAHLDLEVMIVDEVLAVGDSQFREKCLGKMRDVAGSGRTVLFVSHNMAAVSELCHRCAILEGGRLIMEGDVDTCVRRYFEMNQNLKKIPVAQRTDRKGTGRLRFTGLRINDGDEGASGSIQVGDTVKLTLFYQAEDTVTRPDFLVGIYDQYGVNLIQVSTAMKGSAPDRASRHGSAVLEIGRFPLRPGTYRLNIAARCQGRELLDSLEHVAEVKVHEGSFYGTGNIVIPSRGVFLVDHEWRFHQDATAMPGSMA